MRERFGQTCCRETIRAALQRLQLSWKKAKKRLGRADPVRRQAFIEPLQGVLAEAERDRHLLVYLDEAHLHQDADLGYGWAERGPRLWVASSSPGLSAKVSFYGLYYGFLKFLGRVLLPLVLVRRLGWQARGSFVPWHGWSAIRASGSGSWRSPTSGME